MSSVNRRCGGRRPERAAAAVRDDNANGYVETDPTGRYGRFDELLGKGAMKSVYRAFDEHLGMEVAWNQAHLTSILHSPDTINRTYSEVHLLRSLHHPSIISFHASWIDLRRRTFNFITELFVSGTLRSYRRRYPCVSLAAVRRWAWQLLTGLSYLHSQVPPVIHRDLKCDNIFVHGHLGHVKIGDLGLAAVLDGGHRRSVIGTPEFMAPEMYDEEYDERVDVYAFGMCVLEMMTGEYPYSECENPAQIFKKVTSGRLPDAFFTVEDGDARRFIGRCLVSATGRPSADELLLDPFLLDDSDHVGDVADGGGAPAVPLSTCSSFAVDDVDDEVVDHQQEPEAQHPPTIRRSEMSITGKVNAEEDTVFLKVQMIAGGDGGKQEEEGVMEGKQKAARNIYFPFDMGSDTAEEVAEEMVKELEIADRDATEIAAMIQQEIDRLLPGRTQQQQQHEYMYNEQGDDDGDDVEHPPPFCYGYHSSSPASSHGSHCGVGPYGGTRGGGWSKDHHHWYAGLSDNDDDTSTSSLHSGKYSPLHYASGADDDPPPITGSSSKTTTRFGGDSSGNSSSAAAAAVLARQLHRNCSVQSPAPPPQHAGGGRPRRREDSNDGGRRRLTRNRSMVDMRSQVLHRTLVEELNRRLFFNTVGAVENIGFRDPTTTSPSASSSSAAASAAARGRGRGRRSGGGNNKQPLDDKQRYFML